MTKQEYILLNMDEYDKQIKSSDYAGLSYFDKVDIAWFRLSLDRQKKLIQISRNYFNFPFFRIHNNRRFKKLFPEFKEIPGVVTKNGREYLYRLIMKNFDDISYWI